MRTLDFRTRIPVHCISNRWHEQALTALALALFAGCSRGVVDPPELPVAPVSGKVTWGSETPAGARVTLIPIARTEGAVNSTGVVEADGTFKISSYGTNDGAPPGDYTVVIEWFKAVQTDGGSGRGPNVLPQTYASANTSPVKVTIKEGSNVLPPISIPRS